MTPGSAGSSGDPLPADHDGLVRLGSEKDQVHVVVKDPPGDAASARGRRRAERSVAAWMVLSMASAVAFVAVLIRWPHRYVPPGAPGVGVYQLYTPALGLTFGLALLALAVGVAAHVKRFFPEEIAVQQREPDRSSDEDRAAAAARFVEAGRDTGLGQRRLVRRAVLGALGMFGAAGGVLVIGTFVRDPWKGGAEAPLRTTPWRSVGGEMVYLRTSVGVRGEFTLVRPEDLAPAAIATVFPFRESERGDREAIQAVEQASDAPVMLVRFRPGTPVRQRPGQQDFHYGDYYAYSKICTHLGCPASLYDSQENTSLCPCHQSAFALDDGGTVVFGPAVRPLPQLPVTVDADGWFVARGDFVEPVGPSYWTVRGGRED